MVLQEAVQDDGEGVLRSLAADGNDVHNALEGDEVLVVVAAAAAAAAAASATCCSRACKTAR